MRDVGTVVLTVYTDNLVPPGFVERGALGCLHLFSQSASLSKGDGLQEHVPLGTPLLARVDAVAAEGKLIVAVASCKPS